MDGTEDKWWEQIEDMARSNPVLNRLVYAVRVGAMTRGEALGAAAITLAEMNKVLNDQLLRDVSLKTATYFFPPGMDLEKPIWGHADMTRDDVEAILSSHAKEAAAEIDRDILEDVIRQASSPMPFLEWSIRHPPDDFCRYDSVTAETPFGRFLITWKGWKENEYPTVEETPWGGWWNAFGSVDEAKQACAEEYAKRLKACWEVQ